MSDRPNTDECGRLSVLGVDRRAVLGTGAALATGSLGGCVGLLRHEVAATPVVLPTAARREHGYVELVDRTLPIDVSVAVATVTLRSHLASYGPDPAAGGSLDRPTLLALATPDAVVAGRSVNPLRDAPLSELVSGEILRRAVDAAGVLGGDAAGTGGGIASGDWETRPRAVSLSDPPSGTVLGLTATVESFVGLVGRAEPRPVVVHLLRVRPDDVVLVVGIHSSPGVDTDVANATDATAEGTSAESGGSAGSSDRDGSRPLVGPDGYVTTELIETGATATATVSSSLVRRDG